MGVHVWEAEVAVKKGNMAGMIVATICDANSAWIDVVVLGKTEQPWKGCG